MRKLVAVIASAVLLAACGAQQQPAASVTVTTSETAPPSVPPSTVDAAVTRERAVEIALARTGGGNLDKVENEVEHGRAAWKVRIVKDGIRYSSYIDKTTGEILRFRDEGRD